MVLVFTVVESLCHLSWMCDVTGLRYVLRCIVDWKLFNGWWKLRWLLSEDKLTTTSGSVSLVHVIHLEIFIILPVLLKKLDIIKSL